MRRRTLAALAGSLAWLAGASPLLAAERVIMISVDGFRPAGIELLLSQGELRHFARLQAEGVWTHNARTDFDSTYTNPNHVSMVSGRPVLGDDGHLYTDNQDPPAETTLHTTKGSYVASAFDVAHDHGLVTSFHRSKSKLSIIDKSYTETTGAEDTTGEDNGRAKIDIAKYGELDRMAEFIMAVLEVDLVEQPVHLGFIHLVDPDRQGHGNHWAEERYYEALRRVDGYIGRILHLVETNEPYAGRTTLIVTADHGGAGGDHSVATDVRNYTIPFYVWGADVPVAGDLYQINASSRLDPQDGRPDFAAAGQPIRNGGLGNLALDLLGLPSIPGSTINAAQDLEVAAPAAASGLPEMVVRRLPTGKIQVRWTAGAYSRLQVSDNLSEWAEAPGDWPRAERYWLDPGPVVSSKFYRLRRDSE